jgi:hypothetical protein
MQTSTVEMPSWWIGWVGAYGYVSLRARMLLPSN